MAFKSQFGSRSSGFGPSPLDAPASHSTGHGILHNLLNDAINTAKGIPFGVVQTVEHPIRSVEMMGKSYSEMYGHGWHHFWTDFHAHPLQPLLDAISVPLLLAGGAGAAVKGASFAAELGKGAEAADILAQSSKAASLGNFAEADALRADAMRFPKLDAQAQRFRKGTSATTRMVDVQSLPGVQLPKAYSSNLFRRALTKGSEAILEGIGNRAPGSYFSTEHLGERMLAKEVSKRAAATAARSKGQAAVLMGAKKAGLDPNEAIGALGDDLEHTLIQNALWVDAKHAETLASSPQFRENWQFIKAKPGENVEAEIIHPYPGEPAPPGTKMLGPGKTPVHTNEDLYARGEATKVHVQETGEPATRDLGLQDFSHESMMNGIKTLAKRVEGTTSADQAMIRDGKVAIVRSGLGKSMVRDMEGSAKLMNLIYRAPLTAWKGFILGLSPRYFVNNVIGNAGMYAAATNPVEFTRGVLDAVKAVHGVRAAARLQKQMDNTLGGLMARHLPDEWVHQRFGYLQHGALGVDQTAGIRLSGALKRAAHARLYTVTEQVAYRGPQRSALMGALNTDSEFRNLYRTNVAKGMERDAAYRDAANTIISDPRKAAAMEKRVTDWAGQYYHLNSLERKLTAFVPFYTWDRHALRFGKEQVLSRPVRSVVLSQLGALGDKQAGKELGKIPDFMKGAIPVKGHDAGILGLLLGQNIVGRKKILLSAGYNPLAAAADDAGAIASLVGLGPKSAREGVGGQLNPVIAGAISGVTGQNLFSGAKADTHGAGPLGGIYEETFNQLPQAKLIRELMGKTPPTKTKKGTPTLYEKGIRQTVSSILGLNERDFSPQAAARLFDQQEHIKKGRRKKQQAAKLFASSLKSNL